MDQIDLLLDGRPLPFTVWKNWMQDTNAPYYPYPDYPMETRGNPEPRPSKFLVKGPEGFYWKEFN